MRREKLNHPWENRILSTSTCTCYVWHIAHTYILFLVTLDFALFRKRHIATFCCETRKIYDLFRRLTLWIQNTGAGDAVRVERYRPQKQHLAKNDVQL